MNNESIKQLLKKTKLKTNHPQKENAQKEFIKVRTNFRAGSGDDFGFTSCSLK
jgi:hypothetical protein